MHTTEPQQPGTEVKPGSSVIEIWGIPSSKVLRFQNVEDTFKTEFRTSWVREREGINVAEGEDTQLSKVGGFTDFRIHACFLRTVLNHRREAGNLLEFFSSSQA